MIAPAHSLLFQYVQTHEEPPPPIAKADHERFRKLAKQGFTVLLVAGSGYRYGAEYNPRTLAAPKWERTDRSKLWERFVEWHDEHTLTAVDPTAR